MGEGRPDDSKAEVASDSSESEPSTEGTTFSSRSVLNAVVYSASLAPTSCYGCFQILVPFLLFCFGYCSPASFLLWVVIAVSAWAPSKYT